MTGAGAPGAAGIIHCLLQADFVDLTVADANANAVGRYLHNDFVQIPEAKAPDFISKVLELCKLKNTQVIMPLVTRELEVFAAAKNQFRSEGIHLMLSDADALQIANNKARLYEHLKMNGIVTPDFKVVHTLAEFKKAIEELGYPNKQVCFKPSVSNGSRGFRIIDDSKDPYHLLFNEKPDSTYMSYAQVLEIFNEHDLPELIVSEYLPGDEYSIDCIANKGETLIAVPRLRTKMLAGISIAGTFVKHEKMIHYAEEIIKSIGLHGNIGIQVKASEDGSHKILEINPRVQGTIVAGLGAGVNLPLIALKQNVGMPVSQEELDIQWGMHFMRYWTEVYYS